MITLILKITETDRGVEIFDNSEITNPAEAELQKFRLFMTAIREVAMKEAERLRALGRGKTFIGEEAAEKLNLTVDNNPEVFDNL